MIGRSLLLIELGLKLAHFLAVGRGIALTELLESLVFFRELFLNLTDRVGVAACAALGSTAGRLLSAAHAGHTAHGTASADRIDRDLVLLREFVEGTHRGSGIRLIGFKELIDGFFFLVEEFERLGLLLFSSVGEFDFSLLREIGELLIGMGGMMGGARTGQLQRTIDALKADTPRDEALKKIEAKDKDAYAKIKKALDDANKQLADLAKKAEVELPDTTEQQKAKTLEFLAKEKDAIDKLLETDKTDSATAMRSFNELAQKNNITINPVAGRGAMGGMPGLGGAQQPAGRGAQGGARGNTNTIRQIQEKFPAEYEEAQKIRQSDPAAYREKMRELQAKLNEAK